MSWEPRFPPAATPMAKGLLLGSPAVLLPPPSASLSSHPEPLDLHCPGARSQLGPSLASKASASPCKWW